MLRFLFFGALLIAAVTFGGVVFFPLLILGMVIWLLTLPFRLVFALVGGLIYAVFAILGMVFAVLLAPFRLLGLRRA
jgi:hypothetical protein